MQSPAVRTKPSRILMRAFLIVRSPSEGISSAVPGWTTTAAEVEEWPATVIVQSFRVSSLPVETPMAAWRPPWGASASWSGISRSSPCRCKEPERRLKRTDQAVVDFAANAEGRNRMRGRLEPDSASINHCADPANSVTGNSRSASRAILSVPPLEPSRFRVLVNCSALRIRSSWEPVLWAWPVVGPCPSAPRLPGESTGRSRAGCLDTPGSNPVALAGE